MEEGKPGWLHRILSLDPALIRGVLIAASGILAQVLGYTVIEDGTIEAILNAYTSLTALVAVLWIRPSVTPNAKVLAYKPEPWREGVLPGSAQSYDREAVIRAAEQDLSRS